MNRAVPLWAALPEDERNAYRARAEAKRREAWAEYGKRVAAQKESDNPDTNGAFSLAAFGLFCEEQVAGDSSKGVQPGRFTEVLAGWEALTDEQGRVYGRPAREVNKAASQGVWGVG